MPLPSIHHLRAYGADDDGRALAFSILFSEGITSVERYWVTSDEHQSSGRQSSFKEGERVRTNAV